MVALATGECAWEVADVATGIEGGIAIENLAIKPGLGNSQLVT